jgi:hypothetical protein
MTYVLNQTGRTALDDYAAANCNTTEGLYELAEVTANSSTDIAVEGDCLITIPAEKMTSGQPGSIRLGSVHFNVV